MIQPGKKGGIRIRPAKRISSDKGKQDLFDKLSSAIRVIYRHDASKLSFEQLYGCAYKLVQNSWGDFLYNGIRQVIVEEVRDVCHKRLLACKAEAEQRMEHAACLEFLKTLRQMWGDHVMNMLVIRDILIYVDRQYVKSAEVPLVYDMGLSVFRDVVITNEEWGVIDLVQRTLLNMIKNDREGEEIDRELARGIVDMLQELTDTVSYDKKDLFKASVEPSIIDATRNHYKEQAKGWIQSITTPLFIGKVHESLKKEALLADSYLAPETKISIRNLVLEETIKAYDSQILELQENGLANLLDNEEISSISSLYSLYNQCGESISRVRDVIQKHIADCGTQINSTNNEALENSLPGKRSGGDEKPHQGRIALGAKVTLALQWAQKFLNLYSKYNRILKESFNSDQSFQLVINNAFSDSIDSNPRSSEFMSLFIDDCLKKGTKGRTEAELDKAIDELVMLARLLKSKDMFEHYYTQHLSKRLLLGKSQSRDAELATVTKLRAFTEPQFIKKLETMFKDVTMSSELTNDFAALMKQETKNIGFAMVPSVLTNTVWPLPKLKGHKVSEDTQQQGKGSQSEVTTPSPSSSDAFLPPEFQNAIQEFTKFYKTRFNGRQLSWYHHISNVDIKIRFKPRVHELNVSTYQAVILLMYRDIAELDENDPASYLTFGQIHKQLGIPEFELTRQLHSLACGKHKILIKEPKSKQVTPTDKFKFNINFTTNMTRIKIPLIAASARVETDSERKETNNKLAQERKHLIEAAVVRIMKSRKTLEHYNLVMETIEQLKARFTPTAKEIKLHIESLIERDYLERASGDLQKYQYVA